MLDMTVEDCQQKFKNTVMMIDGCAKFVNSILGRDVFLVNDIRTGAMEEVLVNEHNLKAPGRIGNVQIGHGVVYTTRTAARMYKAGISRENLSFRPVGKGYSISPGTLIREIQGLVHEGLADALANEYPKFTIARRKAKQNKGIYAFDKQFSIDCNDRVWYKEHNVGEYKAGYVVFDDSAASLTCLMGELE
jgi:hypothetical protein